jgi:hypothetical protein
MEADALVPSVAAAIEGISVASAAEVDSGTAAATSGTVDGSETTASGVRFHGVQERLRDETEAKGEATIELE